MRVKSISRLVHVKNNLCSLIHDDFIYSAKPLWLYAWTASLCICGCVVLLLCAFVLYVQQPYNSYMLSFFVQLAARSAVSVCAGSAV
jgi:hypothetical protein